MIFLLFSSILVVIAAQAHGQYKQEPCNLINCTLCFLSTNQLPQLQFSWGSVAGLIDLLVVSVTVLNDFQSYQIQIIHSRVLITIRRSSSISLIVVVVVIFSVSSQSNNYLP